MWSPVTPKMHFPSVKQFDNPKFEPLSPRPHSPHILITETILGGQL